MAVFAVAGVKKCKAIPVKDLYIGSVHSVGEVADVVINGQSGVTGGTMVPYNAEIVVKYHMKKEIEYPFNPKEVTKLPFGQVEGVLSGLGFTEVRTSPLNDLKTGWLKKDGSVQQVVISGVDSIKKGMPLEYDTVITIQYHSFLY